MILKVITKTNNNYNDNTDCCDDVEIYSSLSSLIYIT